MSPVLQTAAAAAVHLQQQAHLHHIIRSASTSPYISPSNSLQLPSGAAAAAAAAAAASAAPSAYLPLLNLEPKDKDSSSKLSDGSNVVSSTMEDDATDARNSDSPKSHGIKVYK